MQQTYRDGLLRAATLARAKAERILERLRSQRSGFDGSEDDWEAYAQAVGSGAYMFEQFAQTLELEADGAVIESGERRTQ